MTKKVSLLLTISLLFSVALSAQKPGDWSVGMVFQPCLYWKYNKADWNNRPASYPENPRKFNGWATGISVSRSISNMFSIGGELSYSRQHQDYAIARAYSYDIPHYNATSINRLDYLKMPVFATACFEIGYDSGLFLKVLCGPQLSLNTSYYSKFAKYKWDFQKGQIDYTMLIDKSVFSESHFHQDLLGADGTLYVNEFETPYLYNRLDIGALGGLSLQKKLYRYVISLGVRYELGLTNIESKKADAYFVDFSSLTGSDGVPDPRPATHNRRLVLDLGISRIID